MTWPGECGSCKSENTFGAKDLLYRDNYDFLPVFGGGDVLIFRRKARLNEDYRRVYAAADVWGAPVLKLREARQVTPLENLAADPDGDGGRRADCQSDGTI